MRSLLLASCYANAGLTPDPRPLSVKMRADDRAEIIIYSDIGADWFGDGVTAKMIADELKALKASVKFIDVRINSYGGDVFDGVAIHRLLVDHPATVTTFVDGIAASAASVIAMAGSEIVIAESGMMMIHDAWTFSAGNADDLRAAADRVEAISSEIAKMYAARTGRTEKEMRDLMKQEPWMTAERCIEEKLADKIAENLRMAARAIPGFAQYVSNYSRIPEDRRPYRNAPATTPTTTTTTEEDAPRRKDASARVLSMQAHMANINRQRVSGSRRR